MTARQEFLDAVPEKSRRIVNRALVGAASPRDAIKAMCLSCCGYDRAEVAACPTWRCPINAYRPFRPRSAGPAVAEAGSCGPSEGSEVSEPKPEAASARKAPQSGVPT